MPAHSFVGMWVTADGHIRHELLPNGRYDEARGNQQERLPGSLRGYVAATSIIGMTPALPPMATFVDDVNSITAA